MTYFAGGGNRSVRISTMHPRQNRHPPAQNVTPPSNGLAEAAAIPKSATNTPANPNSTQTTLMSTMKGNITP